MLRADIKNLRSEKIVQGIFRGEGQYYFVLGARGRFLVFPLSSGWPKN